MQYKKETPGCFLAWRFASTTHLLFTTCIPFDFFFEKHMRCTIFMKQVVNILDARERIQQLMEERNWTIYRLAKESGLSQTTISNIFKRNNEPSIPTLKRICDAFGISMSQFFRGSADCAVSEEQQELINNWSLLSDTQRQLLSGLIKTML